MEKIYLDIEIQNVNQSYCYSVISNSSNYPDVLVDASKVLCFLSFYIIIILP